MTMPPSPTRSCDCPAAHLDLLVDGVVAGHVVVVGRGWVFMVHDRTGVVGQVVTGHVTGHRIPGGSIVVGWDKPWERSSDAAAAVVEHAVELLEGPGEWP